ncbi:DUF4097 family beta strand repeat-containing protein [Alishewanella sp. HH-ZS]|uniref:DUF4097 family beta strand repeat-containing protein n=1 Tax=Alishewanella sp. HH-ZS TaxID=1856684 RepID=UPI0008237017|nr:DUF4097 family beta strand repeat-containing protein [Alishewanella sp. HH-ZS]OCW98351.1 hypothetical protein A9165_01295 [Alishewanella sp. HH-ZS]
MKLIQLGAGLCLLLASSLSLADGRQSINEVRTVSPNEQISLEVMRGKVEIRGTNSNQFRVSGKLDEKAEGFTLDSKGGFTGFIVQMPRQLREQYQEKAQGSELVIELPLGSSVSFKGVNVDVSLTQVNGGVEINTVNGDITAAQLDGRVELATVNGAIKSQALNGQLRLRSVNGKISDQGATGRLSVESVNGEITLKSKPQELMVTVVNGEVDLELTDTAQLEISSVNGNVELELKNQNAPRIKGSSVSGKFELKLAANLDAAVSLKTSAGGSIKNSLTADQPSRAKYGPASNLQFTSGKGQGVIDINTVSGRIELKKN